MAEKKPIDWEAIETDYRAGIKSLRVMATEYGVSHVAIKKRADREEWVKDLSAKIKAAAEAKVNKAAVNREVNAARKITDKEVIEVAAETQKGVILSHRKDIGRLQQVCESMTEELMLQAMSVDEIRYIAALKSADGVEAVDLDRAAAALTKVIGLSSRADTFRKLVESKKSLVSMEREAFGIESKTPLDGLTDAVRNIGVSFIPAPNKVSA